MTKKTWRRVGFGAIGFAAVLLVAFAIVFQDGIVRFFATPRAPFQTVAPPPAPDYLDRRAWLAFARAHGEDRETAAELCDLLLLWWRDVAVAQAGSGALALGGVSDATQRVAAALSPGEALRRRREVRRTAATLRQNASPVLALEAMLVRWFRGR